MQQNDQVIWPDQAGLLRASDGYQLRYFSSSSWISALEDPKQLQHPDSPTTDSTANSPSGANPSPFPDRINQENPQVSIYDFASVVEVNKVVCYFAEYAQFFFPVVDIQAVTGALHRHSKRQSLLSPEISAVVAAMCFGASSTLVLSGQVDSSTVEPDFWRDLGHRFLFASGYPLRPTMDNMRAAFLLSASSMAEWNLVPDPTPISVLVRVAQSLGLHRDPATFQCSPREADFRRRLWWSISALDGSYSLAHGLPPVINQASADVQPYDDEANPETKMLTFITRTNLLYRRILEDIYGVRKPKTHIFQQLDRDATKLSRYMAQKAQGDNAQDKFIASSAKMCCDKAIFILHQPYLRSELWPKESRSKALDAAANYIRDYVATMTVPSLAQYRWILSHWNMFHAIAIILQDLTQHPHGAESAELRALIDSTFADFSKPNDHNWKKLQFLQARAWKANQWDIAEDSSDSTSNRQDVNASLSDWDPLFASFLWDQASPETSSSGGKRTLSLSA